MIITRNLLGIAAILTLTQGTAYAYLDPGSASIALQALVGALAAGSLFVASRISRITAFVRRLRNRLTG